MFGQGSPLQLYDNYSQEGVKKVHESPVRKPTLHACLNAYNDHFSGSPNLQVHKFKQGNGSEVLEGPLRVYWGVHCPIQLKQKDGSAPYQGWRRSYCMAITNGMDEEFLQHELGQTMDNGGETLKGRRASLDDLLGSMTVSDDEDSKPTSKFSTVAVRPGSRRRRKNRQKRMSIINGHLFDADTSVFTPMHGSVTNVTVSSRDTSPDVIRQLLAKYKIENSPIDFCLVAVKKSGERRVLKDKDFPLIDRIMLGPLEDMCKIFITDTSNVRDISAEVAHYVGLPMPVLEGFLRKFQVEEEQETNVVKNRYRRYRKRLEDRLAQISITRM